MSVETPFAGDADVAAAGQAPSNPFYDAVWKSVLDTVPAGLVAVDRGGRIIYCNNGAQMALGLEANGTIGRDFREVFCPSLPADSCWLNKALLTKETVRCHHFRMEHPSGGRYALEADFTPIKGTDDEVLGGWVAVREDGEADPDGADPSAGQILDSIAEGLYTVDHEWRITSLNRAAEELTGLREREILGQSCKEVLRADHCFDGCPLATTLEQDEGQLNCSMVLRYDSPQSLPVTANTAVLRDSNGDAIGGVVSFRDLRTQKRVATDLFPAARFEGLVGDDPQMLEVYQLIGEVADSLANVLIMGESGTGKEMVADALVKRSPRHDKPCVKVNCSVFPETVLQNELSGERPGRFMIADGGTLFLNEVTAISPASQVKLLRLIESEIDVRVISATDQDLLRLVQDGSFREDLYYRLNVIPIVLPPLRERRVDIAALVSYFIDKYRLVTGKSIHGVSDEALKTLMDYDFPGNVRELENAVEHAFARSSEAVIRVDKLPLAIKHGLTQEPAPPGRSRRIQVPQVLRALEETHWNRSEAAALLGMSRTTLWRRMKALGLARERDAA